MEGWSFQSALDAVNDGQSLLQAAVPRMDVADLIAAKRKALKQDTRDEKEEEEEQESETHSVSDSENGEDDDKDDGSSSSSEDGSSAEDDSDSEDDEADAAHDMEKDVLTVKAGGDEDGEDGDEDDDDDDDQNSSDEEDKEEVKKADAFFESQSTPSGSKETVELFVQLTLSRPLLRGVAAMGFVKPTPIQASCIPVALSGRDICASAVTGSGKTAGKILLLVSPKSNGKIGHSSHFVSLLPSF